jgi:hypothetical protein
MFIKLVVIDECDSRSKTLTVGCNGRKRNVVEEKGSRNRSDRHKNKGKLNLYYKTS